MTTDDRRDLIAAARSALWSLPSKEWDQPLDLLDQMRSMVITITVPVRWEPSTASLVLDSSRPLRSQWTLLRDEVNPSVSASFCADELV